MSPLAIPDSAAERAVVSLALKAKVPVEEVVQLYEEGHAELDRQARIKSYVPIFAIRRVQDALRQRGRRGSPDQAKPRGYGAWSGGEEVAA